MNNLSIKFNRRFQMRLKNSNVMGLIEKFFHVPTLLELVSNELSRAKLGLLEAEAGVDNAQSLVNYNKARIARLTERLENFNHEEKTNGE